jgi:hypothetical protein
MILHITKILLILHNGGNNMIQQTVIIFCTIFKQNYFQIEKSFFKPMKGVVPIASVVAEIFLGEYGNKIAKCMIQAGYVILHNRRFYYILIIF